MVKPGSLAHRQALMGRVLKGGWGLGVGAGHLAAGLDDESRGLPARKSAVMKRALPRLG